MSEKILENAEEVFKEDLEFQKKINKLKNDNNIDPLILKIEYNVLVEKYGKLLKNAIRIAKMGDMAQKKLIRYKELIDTIQNLD